MAETAETTQQQQQQQQQQAQGDEPKSVFFFDIDNCLYSRHLGVHSMMSELIDDYFETDLHLTRADAAHLHQRYYRDYGLAIEGLVRHHKIDPLEYNRRVDDALPLDEVIGPDPALRQLLLDFDRSKVRLWLFTNAYITHARRVIRLLGLEDDLATDGRPLFDGITFSDYGVSPLLCKPAKEMFEKAERAAGVIANESSNHTHNDEQQKVYFVDDSKLNCAHAEARGWITVNKIESDDPDPSPRPCKYVVRRMTELRDLFPHLFKSTAADKTGSSAQTEVKTKTTETATATAMANGKAH